MPTHTRTHTPTHTHQDLNPLPFVGMCANCTAWLLYGTLTHDFYVYFSNILGLLLAYFYIFTSLKFAPEKVCLRVCVSLCAWLRLCAWPRARVCLVRCRHVARGRSRGVS